MRFTTRGLLPALLSVSWAAFAGTATISPQSYLDDIRFLASPELRGRGTGTPELEKAAAFIAGKFKDFGLQPIDRRGYLQAFDVTTNARLGEGNRFSFNSGDRAVTLRVGEDFIPFNFSAAGKLTGPVVFVGFGITAPEYGYDDFAGVDVRGKVVLMLRHEPQEYDEKSVFAGKIYTQHAQFFSKATNAKLHGATAVILISDRPNHRGDSDELEKFGAAAGPMDAGIPFVQVKAERVDAWFAAAGKSLDDVQGAIDKDLKPQSFPFPSTVRVDGNLDIVRAVKTVHNVAGYLPGSTDEYVVVGAHYDHLGLGEQFSMAPSMIGTIHPGADDNASGTAGVIELARWFSAQPKQKRGILFLAFAGEELGLLGSSYFVSHPTFPLHKAVAMINLDMIGRVREGKVYIGGVGTGANLREMLDRITPKYKLNIDYSDTTGYGSSDHTSFTTKEVPVLFFFSGLHGDYHRPSDTADKIEAPEAAKLLELVAEATDNLRETGQRPMFVRVEPPASAYGGSGGPVGSSASNRGYGPLFGSIPDMGNSGPGVKFADVRPGTPAAKAGLKGGDVMVEFDGKAVGNLHDYTYLLRSKQPGDVVQVKVMRDGAPLEVKVKLEKRQ
jgi:hypothetical protein